MDITRHWRLKTTRSALLAARRPDGALDLPQHSGALAQPVALYTFEAQPVAVLLSAEEDYARAAR